MEMEKIQNGFVIHCSPWRNSLLFFDEKSGSVAKLHTVAVTRLYCSSITGNFLCSPRTDSYDYCTVSKDLGEGEATMCCCHRGWMGLEER